LNRLFPCWSMLFNRSAVGWCNSALFIEEPGYNATAPANFSGQLELTCMCIAYVDVFVMFLHLELMRRLCSCIPAWSLNSSGPSAKEG
jgi:hypothetical protein